MEATTTSPKPFTMERMVRSRDVKDRSFDIIFWQAQSPQARLSAARELVTFAQKIKGRAHDLRLQRSVEILRGRG